MNLILKIRTDNEQNSVTYIVPYIVPHTVYSTTAGNIININAISIFIIIVIVSVIIIGEMDGVCTR